MLSLLIGDNLLVKQASGSPVSPWGYRIVYVPTSTTIATETGLTATYKIVALLTSTYQA